MRSQVGRQARLGISGQVSVKVRLKTRVVDTRYEGCIGRHVSWLGLGSWSTLVS